MQEENTNKSIEFFIEPIIDLQEPIIPDEIIDTNPPTENKKKRKGK